jgi:hypothetical protein
MSDLKTLKDFEGEPCENCAIEYNQYDEDYEYSDDEYLCDAKKLREEAVKWVKYLRQHMSKYEEAERVYGLYFSTSFIIAFFDLSEEDLTS